MSRIAFASLAALKPWPCSSRLRCPGRSSARRRGPARGGRQAGRGADGAREGPRAGEEHGSGDAERGIRYMRRAAHDGDFARVEATWVLAAALMREAARDPAGRSVLEREARGYGETLAARYPGNPVFQRFLREVPAKTSARKTIGAPATAAA